MSFARLGQTRVIAGAAFLLCCPAPALAQKVDTLWTIRGGKYDLVTVHIDSDLATRRSSRFLRISRLNGDSRFVSWNPTNLPVGVAFRPNRGVSADDSIAFWSILRQMELDMGMRLFEPSSLADGSDPDDVIVIDIKPSARDEGKTLVTWSTSGALYDARIYLRTTSTMHDTRTVTHEMMHALGFGHTSMWLSVMNPTAYSPDHLTVDDVAYAQFALASRAANERADMWERLALAYQRMTPDSVRH
ncbi:MAG TPA: hypothetical protein VFT21_00010 [Gemmatimonadaceae bacterium]|nr:hypothetical protein [Gemmatimonadaceae bacterium]